jgi:hypothetical protein
LAWRGQQRLQTSQNRIGAFKKSIQSGIHDFSSGTFTVMMLSRQTQVLPIISTDQL